MEQQEKPRILLVDDRSENLLVLEKLLSAPDVVIMKARSGNEALSLVLDNEFALILMDVQMPEMDGFETAELIRGNSDTNRIPIIFITAISKDRKHVFKGYESGAVDYLFKPFDPDILSGKVKVFLELYRQKIALKTINEELTRANRMILEQQKHVIEEERLKVLLQMAGATAHELSQPLMLMLGSIELLEFSDNLPEKLTHHLNNIKRAGERISQTIRRIQSVHRPETKAHDASARIINLDQQIRILCVEDEIDDFEKIVTFLRDEHGIEFSRVSDMKEALAAMEETAYSLIFLNHRLPDCNGFDFMVKTAETGIETPVVIVTGQGDEILASRMIQAGAYDYLPKSKLGKDALLRVIQHAMEKSQLKREVRLAHQKMAQMSTRDELTGLFNRRYFNEALKQEITRAKRYDIDFSLCILDLDHFKRINDSYGHTVGDAVLAGFAKMMNSCFRNNDIKCRYGGEEFTVIFPHTVSADAYKACEAFRAAVANRQFDGVPDAVRMTTSIGITSYGNSGTAKKEEQVIQQADAALYQAKSTGRNRVMVYNAF